MLSRPLTFLLYGLAMLLAVIFSFSWEAVAQSDGAQLISLPVVGFAPNAFVVYGRAPTQAEAGIVDTVLYRQTTETLPDLEEFFELGATLELVTPTLSLSKHDIVISEIMWGVDFRYPDAGEETYTQWIELYNTQASQHIKTQLFFLFTPLRNYPDRDVVELPNGKQARVLDAISTLHLDKWDLPGESGGRPSVEVVSAYRDIVYSDWEDPVPFGSYEVSWKATPEGGRRNTLRRTFGPQGEELPYLATPGSQHVPDPFPVSTPILKNEVPSDTVVINEVRNDVSGDNLDWIELKNISYSIVQLKNWELSIVTGVGEDIDLVDFPDYEMLPEEVLLLQANHPKFTDFADGINIESPEGPAKGRSISILSFPICIYPTQVRSYSCSEVSLIKMDKTKLLRITLATDFSPIPPVSSTLNSGPAEGSTTRQTWRLSDIIPLLLMIQLGREFNTMKMKGTTKTLGRRSAPKAASDMPLAQTGQVHPAPPAMKTGHSKRR